ncbi:ATP-dependent nuclease [Aeromonas veronii]|uniref:ATP-dependent nuclease n=1 Tax=Aeromonas veronii TaxID=654 RepID=UPI000956D6C1|nr:AAA family ATPase [Aeromonas veronii]SIR52761.1 Predicted ATP-dependent endonuclease of the OLD family, contains P-loop ATPase and TOPRIM domains [Aeromonas veronii]
MKIENLRIRNFRTIGQEQSIDLTNGVTIVGPNSSGKTNILKAIELIFTGFENKFGYELKTDKTFGITTEQTTLTVTFSGDRVDLDKDFFELYDELNDMLEEPKPLSNTFQLYLSFPNSENPKYVFFANEKRKPDTAKSISRIQRQAVSVLLDKFICHYVPSSKSIGDLYSSLLQPFIKRYVAKVLDDKLQDINNSLKEISNHLDTQLKNAGLNHITSHFSLPNNSLEELIHKFEFNLSDPNMTSIERKGMGIQASAILASFLWITKEERKLNKSTIWLIEEPESYLHPELAGSCHKMLNEIGAEALLVTTTHSLAFVSQDPTRIAGTVSDASGTKIIKYDNYVHATTSIRKALGVRFSDYYNLGISNIFVEGKSDREVFKWFLEHVTPELDSRYEWPFVRKSDFLDFTGVAGMEAFMKATYEFIYLERPVVTILDGDSAGDNTRKSLQNYFGNKRIPFQANKDFVTLHDGFSLEGLFPHSWIIEANDEHPNWFSNFATDVQGVLKPFDVRTAANKEQLRNYLKEKAIASDSLDWAERFITVFNVVEAALKTRNDAIYRSGIN